MTQSLKTFLTIGLVFLLTLAAQAQVTVSGTVSDTNGETLPGVTVLEVGTSNGVSTNIDGSYTLRVSSKESVLSFTYIGFEGQEILVGDRTVIDVTLSEDFGELEEVVVIGYGTRKKKVLTGAVSSVTSEELNKQPVARIDQAIQGRVAGVQILNQSGQPGEAPQIRIRGIGTNGDNSPLILVDGIAVASIDNLNAGDIQSVEVLKDAASSSIYGARAANGVILITTKSGSAGESSITYSGYVGVQNVVKTVDVLNASQYQQLMADGGASNLNGDPFDENEIPQNNTNWQNELYSENVPIESHEISMSGGTEKSTFSASISYFNQEGIIGGDKSKLERYIGRIKGSSKINDYLKVGSSVNYTHLKARGVTSNGSFNSELGSALNIDPLTAVYETDSDVLNDPTRFYLNNPVVTDPNGNVYAISNNVGQEVVNPLAQLEIQNGAFSKDQILGRFYAEAYPTEGLTFKTDAGIDLSFLENNNYNEAYFLSATNNREFTGLFKSFARNVTLQWENTLMYEKEVGDHRFNGLIGTTAVERKFEDLFGTVQGAPVEDPNLRYLGLGVDSTMVTGSGAFNSSLLSYFGRILYDYKDRISFSATYRRDGSSNFGSNNQFGNFMSFGASWVINEEPFFPDIRNLSFLKVRASWGQNGNDRIPGFAFESPVDFNIAYNLQGAPYQGATPAFFANQDIRWESSNQLDIAIETGLFDNRLTATLDYYKRVTEGLLQFERLPGTLGIPGTFNNVGEMQNEGFEIELGWRNTTGDFSYSISANATYNKNTMTKIADESGFIPGASWALAGEVTRIIEGQPVTSFFGYKAYGIFRSQSEVFSYIGSDGTPIQPNAQPGDIRFVDVNGDGQITDDDRTVIGSPLPDWVLGSNLSASYKNFDFSALFSGSFGLEVFNGMGRPDIPTSNRQVAILDRWTLENPTGSYPRFAVNDPNRNYTRVSDMINIRNGSFVRVRNIQVGYTFSPDLVNRVGATNWRVYFSVENLHTFTGYEGSDPEVGGPTVVDTGIDRGIYPQPRTFRVGTSISF
ncbi:SusC/RagA family TonB-linked outer membrane protein [Ekhidna sp.]|uniref:SusC/RagA family TonB-linked outer membrane protein n=1 Tax=Ekhidna sp. TaxID=2608089 RepID=UPI003CCC1EC0